MKYNNKYRILILTLACFTLFCCKQQAKETKGNENDISDSAIENINIAEAPSIVPKEVDKYLLYNTHPQRDTCYLQYDDLDLMIANLASDFISSLQNETEIDIVCDTTFVKTPYSEIDNAHYHYKWGENKVFFVYATHIDKRYLDVLILTQDNNVIDIRELAYQMLKQFDVSDYCCKHLVLTTDSYMSEAHIEIKDGRILKLKFWVNN